MKTKTDSLFSIFLTFLRFGIMAWGGPIAQINMLREDLVNKNKWVSEKRFYKTLALYQALPGPEALEMCIYLGVVRGGKLAGIIAGAGFILPGLLFILLFSFIYKNYGASYFSPLFLTVTPVIAAIIIRAAHRIGDNVLLSRSLAFICFYSIIMKILGSHFILILITCAIFHYLWCKGNIKISILVIFAFTILQMTFNQLHYSSSGEKIFSDSGNLFLAGLEAGMLSFGGAYTAIPFLHDSTVGVFKGITNQTFLDGVALVNIIPAPFVVFSTFIGFQTDNLWGAAIITVGIFLPAFLITIFFHKKMELIIENKVLHNFLDGIMAGVVGLLIFTSTEILINSVSSSLQATIFIISLLLLYLWKNQYNTPAIILFFGLFGYLIN